MPNSVQSAAPESVMPWSLCRSFSHERGFPVIENEYLNGESQRGRQADTSRKRWRLSQHLSPAALDELREFYEGLNGPHEPFYFYDVWDTSPKYTYDATGTETTGRYTVRFDCDWEQVAGIARGAVDIAIVEIA